MISITKGQNRRICTWEYSEFPVSSATGKGKTRVSLWESLKSRMSSCTHTSFKRTRSKNSTTLNINLLFIYQLNEGQINSFHHKQPSDSAHTLPYLWNFARVFQLKKAPSDCLVSFCNCLVFTWFTNWGLFVRANLSITQKYCKPIRLSSARSVTIDQSSLYFPRTKENKGSHKLT